MAASVLSVAEAQTPAAYANTAELQLALNKSRIVTTERAFTELSVGSSAIADVVALSSTAFYIVGKAVGSTNVIVSDRSGSVIGVYDVSVGYDVDGLKRKIFEIAPNSNVEIRAANDAVVLSGAVADAGMASSIAAVAERYAPGKVTNMMTVSGSQQVMLEVKFAEVQRAALKDIGANLKVQDLDVPQPPFAPPGPNQVGMKGFNDFVDGAGNLLPGLFGGGTLDSLNPLGYAAFGGTLFEEGEFALTAMFDLLEQKGLVRTLAEPNIVALSGDTANFLAGGEFPIPIAQSSVGGAFGNASITVEFKQFGVGLAFTPTVTGRDSINLELAAEVSSIDPTVSTTLASLTIPGLKVRRTNTTVELRDGQSFAIAGLIQDDLTNQIRAIPGLGSIPILGALARSTQFERRETELVVVITARLVKPVSGKQLSLPTNYILAPSEMDFFMLGKPETVRRSGDSTGIDGSFGYVQP
jgi:pilus assembly protein CpaC